MRLIEKGLSEESRNLVTNQQKSKAWVIVKNLAAKGEEFVCRTDGWIEKNTYGKKPKEYLDLFQLNGRKALVLGKFLILSKQNKLKTQDFIDLGNRVQKSPPFEVEPTGMRSHKLTPVMKKEILLTIKIFSKEYHSLMEKITKKEDKI